MTVKLDFITGYEEKMLARKTSFEKELTEFGSRLVSLGITGFKVEYSGSGDDGEIHGVDIFTKPDVTLDGLAIEIGEWEKWDNKSMGYKVHTEPKPIVDYLEDFCYRLLQANCPGWEINDGQSGDIEWDYELYEGKITHNYCVPQPQYYREEY